MGVTKTVGQMTRFAALKSRVDLLDVARRAGLSLQQRGRRWWTCCPIHGEKTASLMMDEAGRWHCFGCGAGGDAIDLVARMQGTGPLEAARWLDATYNLHLFDGQPAAVEVRRQVQAAQAERDNLAAFENWALWAGNVLAAWLRELDALKRDIAPQRSDDEFPPFYAWACQELDYWEALYLGAFVNGGFREQVGLYKERRGEVEGIDRALFDVGEGRLA